MNTAHLKYFYDVFRLESVVEAARVNHVAPSTISQALRALENDFGYELTSKQRGQLKLTEKASVVARKIPALLAQVEEIRSIKSNTTSELTGQLRIATHQSLLASHLWMPIRTFKKDYPKVEINVFTGVGMYLTDMLLQNHVDLIVTIEHPGKSAQLRNHLLHQGNFVLAGKNPSLFSRKSPVVVTNKTKIEVEYLIKHNPWVQLEELLSWSTVKNVLMSEDVFGYLPDYLIDNELKKGIINKVTKVKKQDFKFKISSWFKKENLHNPAVVKFHELAERAFKKSER